MRYLAQLAIGLAFAVVLSVPWGAHSKQQKQKDPELEKKIERIFLYQPVREEKYDHKAEIEKLGNEPGARAILINMLTKYRYAKPGTLQYLYLSGATHSVGRMGIKNAAAPLSQFIFDKSVHENVRAVAVKSLGLIDAEGNKKILLRALHHTSDYFLIRINAAEALAKTKDSQALAAIERSARKETDSYVRQQFEKSARELKLNMQPQS